MNDKKHAPDQLSRAIGGVMYESTFADLADG